MADSVRPGARSRTPLTGGFLPSASPRPIDPTTAVIGCLGAWVLGQIVSAIIIGVLAGPEASTDATFSELSAGLVGVWASYLAVMWVISERAGSASFVQDYGFSFRLVDITGLGIGAIAQLVLLRVVYLPLEALWPDTFTQDRLEENAQDLVDRAGGAATLLLIGVVVIGAPIVEELFYRGLLQRPLAARFSEGPVLVAVAAVFAAIHLRPVEFPGLFVFGLVLGFAALRTRRLGMSIAIHVGFNATALLLLQV